MQIVIIRNIELFRLDMEFMLRVTSANGVTGIILCNQRIPNLVSMLHGEIKNRKIAVPSGNGLGITYDASIWVKAELIK